MIGYYEGFDYGGDVAEKEDNFILWSTTGSRTCLVDADLLPYRVGFTIGETNYLAAKALVADGTCKRIEDTPQFESAFDQLCSSLNLWVRKTKCDSAILYSTKSASNFRLDIAYTDLYKGQRTAEKPPFFTELKDAMTERLGCILADGIEADDWLSIEASRRTRELGVEAGSPQHKEFCDVVIASSDKDSAITPCWNWNPDTYKMQWVTKLGELVPKYKNAMVKDYAYVGTGVFWKKGEKAGQEKTKRVCIGEKPSSAITKLKGSGLKFFYAQILMGDAADNYKGLPNWGMTGAYNLLCNCKSEKELYMAVLKAYKEVYGTGTHWCPHYKGTQHYYDEHVEHKGCPPPDWGFWKGKGAWLTAYDRMLEQGRLAWMMTYEGDIWRKDKGAVINPHDKEFWHDPN
ncbi:hypothetical protein PODOV006v2_p0029 [Vibrio phage 15E36.1]|uniref:Exonuclease n=1 Tax=Vibrio phage 15E36.1 TaxID=2859290 RepID=A0AAE7XUP2_9CAUD|nr:hypothetical protein PODOV006v2_p0029 [Vibrio phage 15E36.1]